MIRVGMTRSNSPLQLMITSCRTGVSASISGSSSGSSSRSPRSKSRSSSSATGAVIGETSLPAQDEAVNALDETLLNERVAGRAAPGREVGDRAGIGGKYLEQLARRDGLHRLGGPDDRHGALEALRIERGHLDGASRDRKS